MVMPELLRHTWAAGQACSRPHFLLFYMFASWPYRQLCFHDELVRCLGSSLFQNPALPLPHGANHKMSEQLYL